MCGIFGLIADLSELDLRSRAERATKTLSNRGPDNQSVVVDGSTALGHSRLSIVDLSESANQPMVCGETGVKIVLNGEIYNYKSLRQQLQSYGHVFQTNSDTEVLLRAYLQWREDCFPRLNGIFAVAISDPRNKSLVIARDRFGVKPLYLYEQSGQLCFASEAKAILAAVSNFDNSISMQSLHEFMYFGVALGQKTLWKNIQQIAPGEWVRWLAGDRHSQRYWHVPTEKNTISQQETEIVGQTRELLEKAVSKQLTGDVPIGVFLSGGIDSSCITAFASRHYSSLKTFSVAFDFHRWNELPLARKVAKTFNTDHHEFTIKGEHLPEVIVDLVAAHDAPFSDAANIPLYLLCKQLQGEIKVVLQGDGGDELFAGYRRYASLHSAWFFSLLAKLPGRCMLPDRFARYLECFLPDNRYERFARLLTVERTSLSPIRALSEPIRERLVHTNPFSRYHEIGKSLEHLDDVQAMLLTDMQIILPDVFLEKVDKSTMRHGVEVRVPFLENELSEYVMRLPSSTKVKRGKQKWLLKQSLRGIVPDEVLDAPKRGFGVPFSSWLRGPLNNFARQSILSGNCVSTEIFDRSFVENAFADHENGTRDNGLLLWKLMNLSIWFDKFSPSIK